MFKKKNTKLGEGVLEASCFSWLILFGISEFSFSGHVPNRMMLVPPFPLCTGVARNCVPLSCAALAPSFHPREPGAQVLGQPPRPHTQTVPSIPRNAVSTANAQRLSGGAALGWPQVTAAPLIWLVAFSLQLLATFRCL